jgi:hypothetical protein
MPTNDIRSINDNKYFMAYPPIVAIPQVFSKYVLNNVGDRKERLQSRSQTKYISIFNIGHGFQKEFELA